MSIENDFDEFANKADRAALFLSIFVCAIALIAIGVAIYMNELCM